MFAGLLGYSQEWKAEWTKRFYASTNITAPYSVSDSEINVYISGQFSGTVTFDSYTITAIGALDGYVLKLDKNGNVVFLKIIAGSGNEQTSYLTIHDNYLYLVMNCFSNPTIVDGNSITTYGSGDILLYKLSLDGTYTWCKNMCYGATNQTFSKIMIDSHDNIIFTGAFLTSATMYGGSISLSTIYSQFQPFISKCDTSGNVSWVKVIESDATTSGTAIIDLTSDGTQYYFTGQYNKNLYFDIDTISAATTGKQDVFIYAIDYNGDGKWIRKISGINYGKGLPRILCHDSIIYLCTNYQSADLTVDSTASSVSLRAFPNASTGTNDIFYATYDTSGTLQFAKRYGGTGGDSPYSIFNLKQNIFISGIYEADITFDSYNLTNYGDVDGFIIQLKNNITVWTTNITGLLSDGVNGSLLIDSNSNIVSSFRTLSNPYTINGISYPLLGTADLIIQKYTSPYKVLSTGNKFLKFNGQVINYK